MISDEEKRKIEDSIILAFEKQGYLRLSRMLKSDSSARLDWVKEDRFLKLRALNPAMHIHILKKRSKNSTITKHRNVMIRATLNSLVDDTFTLMDIEHVKDPDDYGSQLQDHKYTDRHTRRLIRDRYKDVFFEDDSSQRHGNDGRKKKISTVFSGSSLPYTKEGGMALELLAAAREVESNSEQLFLASNLRFAFPEFLEDLLRFRDECRDVFENLGKNNDRIDFLRERLTEITPLMITLYSHLGAILDVVWFSSIPAKLQMHLLETNFKIQYGPSNAGRAKELLGNIYEHHKVVEIFNYCGTAFLRQKMTDEAICMFEVCLDMAETNMDKGSALQSIACTHRISQNYRLALRKMRDARVYFEKTEDVYRVCNAIQLIAESQWQLGNKDAAIKSFEDVEMHGQNIETGKKWFIYYILGMSFGRLGEWTRRKKYLTKALMLIPDDYDVNHILWLNNLIDNERPLYSDDILPPEIRQKIMNHAHNLPFLAPEDSGKSVRPFRVDNTTHGDKDGADNLGA